MGFKPLSHFQPVTRAHDEREELPHQENANEQPGEQAGNNDQGERPLGVRAHAGGQRGGQQPVICYLLLVFCNFQTRS